MADKWPEYHEGMRAYDRTKSPEQKLPYWNWVDQARRAQWLEGWKAAEREAEDDDYDD